MGRQIQIAHDDADERSLIAWLERKGDFRSLPANARASELRPAVLADCRVARQAVFLAKDERRVLEGARPSPEDPHLLVVTTFANGGWYFEWSRTESDGSSVYSPTGVGGSRIYFPAPTDGAPSSDEIRKVFTALVRWIRKSSPSISIAHYPVYVGRSLSERVARGGARLETPRGEVIELVRNPRYVGA